ncbi:MAG: PRC-barrel domain-containing protein, partial [Brevibacterium aurantiacum]|nr:PRC-barrel domain-containing protein [Brevibacterium aurantiacum]
MDRSEIQNLIGGTVIDSEGKDAGKIGMIYLDDETNEPDWVSVNTGLFGNKETFVPLEGSRADGDNLHVPFTKDKI